MAIEIHCDVCAREVFVNELVTVMIEVKHGGERVLLRNRLFCEDCGKPVEDAVEKFVEPVDWERKV